MRDEDKTKEQLINELTKLRQRITEFGTWKPNIRGPEEAKFDDTTSVCMSPAGKPYIPDEMLAKWQRIVDLMARIVGVPTGLIMRVDPPQIEVLVASSTEGNPYKKGEKADLDTGLYCETVMAQRSLLLVPDALKDPNWDHNPDIELGMVSYLGFPLQWPDGVIFGTICVLDSKENLYSTTYQELLAKFKEQIEGDLRSIIDIIELKRTKEALRNNEARYRAIIEDQTELICRFLPDGRLTFVNEAYCRYFGKKSEELTGHTFMPLIPAEDREIVKNQLTSLSLENPVTTYEHRVVAHGGEIRWQQWSDRAIFDKQGRLVEFQSVGRDITDRKRAEETLQKSEEELRFLSYRLLTIQEEERQRIARELHDSIGQFLSFFIISIKNALEDIDKHRTRQASELLQALVPMIKNAIEEIRSIYTCLRPSIIDNLGILATIDWFCREFEETCPGICIEKRFKIQEHEMPENLKITIFRVLQEALSNIVKHSKADLVRLFLGKTDNEIELVIEDNGLGFDPEDVLSREYSRKGIGLTSMRKRTELSSGSFAIKSIKGKGTNIQASWPCKS